MIEPHRLPIIVTVSGHRDLLPGGEPVLEQTVRRIFETLRDAYPATPLLLLTPLAAGADRLVARVAIALGVPFRVPMPMPEKEYRKDFDAAETAEFDELIARADERYTMPFVGDNTADNVADPDRRARQYAMVGAYIARVSHVLIALWNGKPSTAVGGTAQIVEYRLRGAPEPYRSPTALLDAPDSGPVYHVFAPRRSDPQTDEPAGTLVVLSHAGRISAAADPFRPTYERVERFNRDVEKYGPQRADETSATSRLRHVAEHLATHFQRCHYAALNWIFVLSTLAALLLVVGNFKSSTYVNALSYGGLVLLAVAVYLVASRGHWQDRFIEYRALELGLSVQRCWDLAGLDASVADVYFRLQRSELDWVREAIRAMHHLDGARDAGSGAEALSSVRAFVDAQRSFFRAAANREHRRCVFFERVTIFFFVAGALLTAALAAAAAAHAGDLLVRLEDNREWIAAAAICAAVAHEYPRRRAFHAQARRYAIMFRIYERALTLLDDVRSAPPDVQRGRAQEVALEIGREALAENGDWVMMHRELPIEMVHV